MYRDLFLLVVFLGVLSQTKSYAVVENSAEFIVKQNESEIAKTFWTNRPLTVLIELREKLLENVKNLWEKENETSFPVNNIVLSTFDSRGLQQRSTFNETQKFIESIRDLRSPLYDREDFKPTMHSITELIENLSDGSVLLFAMTRPSDEDFTEILGESLMRKRCELSVLWSGPKTTGDYYQLRNLAIRSGGKFGFLSENSYIENEDVEPFTDTPDDISERVRFPDDEKVQDVNDVPLTRRISDQKVWQKISVPLIMEVASGASLETRPGTPTQIPFTVKNNLNIPLAVFFNAKFNGIMQVVQPQQDVLQPGIPKTVNVIIQPIGVGPSTAVGTVTLFGVVGNKPTSRSALVFLTPQTINDNTDPKMSYKYDGNCDKYKEPHNCENGHWGLEATIHDEDSGLLKVLSEPYGLLFQSEFVAGTKTPVQVYYGATCCQPTVQIWAEDLKGNYVRKSFDVFNQNLLAGEIASIVLGILVLILIIVGIIVAVVLVKRRNRRNLIIPRPRTESR